MFVLQEAKKKRNCCRYMYLLTNPYPVASIKLSYLWIRDNALLHNMLSFNFRSRPKRLKCYKSRAKIILQDSKKARVSHNNLTYKSTVKE